MTWPIVFRLYGEDGALFVRVRVHESVEAMRARHVELAQGGDTHPIEDHSRTLGYCTEWQRWWVDESESRRDPCVAEVNLAADYLGTGIVTHELFHATMAWARRFGFDFSRLGAEDSVNEDEERLAYLHGALVSDFVTRAYAAGLYDAEEEQVA